MAKFKYRGRLVAAATKEQAIRKVIAAKLDRDMDYIVCDALEEIGRFLETDDVFKYGDKYRLETKTTLDLDESCLDIDVDMQGGEGHSKYGKPAGCLLKLVYVPTAGCLDLKVDGKFMERINVDPLDDEITYEVEEKIAEAVKKSFLKLFKLDKYFEASPAMTSADPKFEAYSELSRAVAARFNDYFEIETYPVRGMIVMSDPDNEKHEAIATLFVKGTGNNATLSAEVYSSVHGEKYRTPKKVKGIPTREGIKDFVLSVQSALYKVPGLLR